MGKTPQKQPFYFSPHHLYLLQTEEKNEKNQTMYKFGITSQTTKSRKRNIEKERGLDYVIVWETNETDETNGFLIKLFENTVFFSIGKLHGKNFSFLCENHFFSDMPTEKMKMMLQELFEETKKFSKKIVKICKKYTDSN